MNYTDMCKEMNCPDYIRWDFGGGRCYSCKRVGQSYIIDKLADDCPFKEDIMKMITEINQRKLKTKSFTL